MRVIDGVHAGLGSGGSEGPAVGLRVPELQRVEGDHATPFPHQVKATRMLLTGIQGMVIRRSGGLYFKGPDIGPRS